MNHAINHLYMNTNKYCTLRRHCAVPVYAYIAFHTAQTWITMMMIMIYDDDDDDDDDVDDNDDDDDNDA